jgi:CheY-like chemotaxis protein
MEADPSQIQQIIMNLVINAAEAIDDVEGTICVSTGMHWLVPEEIRNMHLGELNPGTHIYVRVSDTGRGMDEDVRAKIFDPFFTTKFAGRGLGMAAVSGIIRGHRGAIRVDSTPGKGSMFTVLFPTLRSGARAEHAKPSERTPSLAELSGTGTVLIAEDEKVVIEVSKTALARYGYTVLLAVDGEEALEIFRTRSQEIALVLLDIGMPKRSGEEVFHQMKTIRPEVPIIITSGYNDVVAAERFKGAEVNIFLQKPYTADELAMKIKAVLSA